MLQKVIEKDNIEKEKQQSINENKKKRATTAGNKFRSSYLKYVNNNKLVAADYNNLLRKVRQPDDSPLRTKVSELKQQFQQRKNPFYDFMVNLPTPVGDGIMSSPTTPAHVPVASVREQVQNNLIDNNGNHHGSEVLFLDMIRKINSSTDHIPTSSI